MKRREFLVTTTALTATAAAPIARAAEPAGAGRWIELRKYSFATPEKMNAYAAFLATAAIPAFNRAGVKPVGALKLLKADNPKLNLSADATDLYLILAHDSAESISQLADRLDKDEVYRAAGRQVIEAPRTDPAFQALQISLLHTLDALPKIEIPTTAPGRVLQLRIYTNHNEDRALRKEEMFGLGGELAIFRRVGLQPVLFSRALGGVAIPNVTYLLGFDSLEKLDAAWQAFREDADWKTLKTDTRFADTEPTVVNLILRPIDGSQI